MWRLADSHIDEFIADGRCEFLAAYAKPFSLLVVADLLGVPEEDHEEFRESFGARRPGSNVGGLDHEMIATNPLAWADEKFSQYIEERRESPRDDVLTSIATAKYPDGSTPEVFEVVRTATFLFAAGQETTAKLLGAALRVLGDRPDIQQQLRKDRSLIPSLHRGMPSDGQPGEESSSEWPRRTPALGETPVPAGTTVMVGPGAANRDPKRFENPHEFSSTAATSANTSRSAEACTPARARRWRASRGGCRSSASWTGWATSPSTRRARHRRCAQLHLRADVHPARADRDEHQVHPVGLIVYQGEHYVSPRSHRAAPSLATHDRNMPSGA